MLLLLIVGEFVSVFFQLCFINDGFTPSITSDEERVEEIHSLACLLYSNAGGGRDAIGVSLSDSVMWCCLTGALVRDESGMQTRKIGREVVVV